ncbi:hypothetical protein [Alkalispirochaeta sphaeroplastigenens]|uniref:hypothetical protein n=1 Tax=Alkalispirochaeta sphaeroplastigenens TaxID=1187066 RepID=UPI0011AF4F75|nr:hypothetical protein [Alkalispirochaeta sphaeroplastigenens]
MKRFGLFSVITLTLVLVGLTLASCASAPEPEPEEAPEAPPLEADPPADPEAPAEPEAPPTPEESPLAQQARESRSQTRARKDEALGVRADVAQREQFQRGEDLTEAAEAHLAREAYQEALRDFDEAREAFTLAYEKAREQREHARRSLLDLDSRLEDASRRIETLQEDMEADDE